MGGQLQNTSVTLGYGKLVGHHKITLDDKFQVLLLLSSLPDSWETFVVSLSNSAPDGVLSLSMIKDSLYNEETRRKDMGMYTS